ncbi:MAG TPA: glycosyltransferase [Pirellulales bacterium]|jgi:glycosyltransferase involved in cell wall biosynthesis|nr:glycosyltransferase [Pirellulales bacterium]
MNDLCVIGFPSKVGGADTELDHQIHCWQALGLQVHLIHTGTLDANLQAMRMEERGCVIHEPRDWRACRGMHVISYCNGEFLKHLPQIKEHARSTTFVNCMTWLFDAEIAAHRQGLIDQFLYQTDHAIAKVKDRLVEANPCFRPFKVRPYFHAADFPFIAERPRDRFRFGRVSREDADKFHQAQLWVYETMVAPVLKEGVVLGINDRIRRKVGTEPSWIKGYPAGSIPAQQVYAHSDCIIQMTDTYENLPRVAFEAMSSGSVLIVDDRGGWREVVEHGQTGYLCRDQREFVYYASRTAFEHQERRQMAAAARDWLDAKWGMAQAKAGWGEFFSQLN